MCSHPVTPTEERFAIEGQVVTSFSGVVARLSAAHPSLAVEEGAAEMLAVEASAQIDG